MPREEFCLYPRNNGKAMMGILAVLHLFCSTPRPILHLEPWKTETINDIAWAPCQMASIYTSPMGSPCRKLPERKKSQSVSSPLSFCFGVSALVVVASLNNGSCPEGTPWVLDSGSDNIVSFFHPFRPGNGNGFFLFLVSDGSEFLVDFLNSAHISFYQSLFLWVE